jgi:hypothetical protein
VEETRRDFHDVRQIGWNARETAPFNDLGATTDRSRAQGRNQAQDALCKRAWVTVRALYRRYVLGACSSLEEANAPHSAFIMPV